MVDTLAAHNKHTRALRIARIAAASILLWAGLTIVFSVAIHLELLRRGRESDFIIVLVTYGRALGPWIVFGPAVFHLARHHASSRATALAVIWQIPLAAFGVAAIYIGYISLNALARGAEPLQSLASIPYQEWLWDVFLFSGVYLAGRLNGVYALREQARDRAQKAESHMLRLKADMARLENRHLRHRFSSHFVMNALSNVLGLVRAENKAAAEDAILTLSDILRRLPREDGAPDATLGEELDFLGAYLKFQKIRYPVASFTIDAPADARAVRFPPQGLQPLVENMFKHGMSADGALEVSLTARLEGGRLLIALSNSIRQKNPCTETEGEGVRLVRSRLDAAFPGRFALTRALQDGQYIVSIDAPAETTP